MARSGDYSETTQCAAPISGYLIGQRTTDEDIHRSSRALLPVETG